MTVAKITVGGNRSVHWGNPRPHVGRSASNPLMVCFRMRRSASISPFQFLRQLCFSAKWLPCHIWFWESEGVTQPRSLMEQVPDNGRWHWVLAGCKSRPGRYEDAA